MRRVLSFAALSLIAIASTASAQRTTRGSTMSANPSPELGVDAGLTFTLDDPKSTSLQIPIQSVRMGFYVSPVVSLEPFFGLNHTSYADGGGKLTLYTAGVGLLYHFAPSRMANQFYARPFIDLEGISTDNGSDSAFRFGAGFGVKMPIGNRFASRFEGNFSHASNDGATQNAIGLLAGLSVYTH